MLRVLNIDLLFATEEQRCSFSIAACSCNLNDSELVRSNTCANGQAFVPLLFQIAVEEVFAQDDYTRRHQQLCFFFSFFLKHHPFSLFLSEKIFVHLTPDSRFKHYPRSRQYCRFKTPHHCRILNRHNQTDSDEG